MKRRSCGEQESQDNEFITEASNNLILSQRENGATRSNQFAQRKYSQQVPLESQRNFQDDMLKNFNKIQVKNNNFINQNLNLNLNLNPSTKSKHLLVNPKDEIINFISKYIKSGQQQHKHDPHSNKSQEQVKKEAKDYEETIQNLRDFLSYLEDKNIINTKQLENNKEEMNNLINDLMKLDLKKFTHKLNENMPATCKNSPLPSQQQPAPYQKRRNSADQVVQIEIPQNINCQMGSPVNVNNRYNSNVPAAENNKIVYYCSPLNVNGNNNIVNANLQIYSQPQPQPQPQSKAYNCSQKLFSQNQNEQLMIQLQEMQVKAGMDNYYSNQQQEKKGQVHMNFAFGDARMDQANEVLVQAQKPHFHQRKHSMFVQGEGNKASARYNNQQPDPYAKPTNQQYINIDQEEDEVAVPVSTRLTHRRATTNLIKPTGLQNMLVQQVQQPLMQPVFKDDVGMIDEREKLIKYVSLYTSKNKQAPQTTLDYYKFTKLIGKGAFGKVTLGIHKLTGKQVAIKTVDKALMKDDYQKRKVLQEVFLLQKVRHSNVIRLLEVFESPKHLLMVMEYAGGGDLLQYVKRRKRLDEDEARRIFRQIVYGLAHCHCRSVLHRDIKLDNILLDNDGEIKICDFGVSRVIQKDAKITEQCGTPAYIAPEIISDGGYSGFSADIWSLGVLLYAMLCGTVPFKAQNMHELHQIITNGSFSFPSNVEPLLSPESKDLIKQMLVINPKDRISIPEILSHKWMQSNSCDDLFGGDEMGMALSRKDMMLSGQMNEGGDNGDINNVNIDNLFNEAAYNTKLSYSDYCAITQDFATIHIDEEALSILESLGFPKKTVKDGINKGELNHATASYNLLVLA